ncbi:MAG: hypothetical protein IJZ22_05630 [Bacteroidaceae bacterium]|nr:hypothetical protein [Bacteroidaceae bacterium]
MKKEYIKPQFELVEMQTWEIIARSVPITDETTDDDANMINRHHNNGEWGNIWGNK